MALKRCVIKFDPDLTASSPCDRLAAECPTATLMPMSVRPFMASNAPGSSGAKVTMITLSRGPYTSFTDARPCKYKTSSQLCTGKCTTGPDYLLHILQYLNNFAGHLKYKDFKQKLKIIG